MPKQKPPSNVFDQFHKHPVCEIPDTGRKQIDYMQAYRPNKSDMEQIKDYNITQAYTIMDRDPVKIRIHDTDCQFKLHPPGFTAVQKANGMSLHGPLETFLMEDFQHVIDYYQDIAQQTLKDAIAARKKKEGQGCSKIRKALDKLLGPDWFQELSPKQRSALDDLAKAVLRDLAEGSIENCRLILNRLGLVLRPARVCVKKALRLCASCPVEFLLVLYQICNPERTSYSINDRILLSSVYHLTIRSTLKELHVRIPSPPRSDPKTPAAKKQGPTGPLRSPYLENLKLRDKIVKRTFHVPNKFYANNEYFNYTQQLSCNKIMLRASAEGTTLRDFQYQKTYFGGVCTCDNCSFPDCTAVKDIDEFTRIEIELITEWTKAQKYYNSLAKAKYVPALFKPSVCVCPIGKFRPRTSVSTIVIANSEPVKGGDKKEGIGVGLSKGDLIFTEGGDTTVPSEGLETEIVCACKSLQQQSQVSAIKSAVFGSDQEAGCICSVDDTYSYVEEEETYREVSAVSYDNILECRLRDVTGPFLEVKTVESQTCACKEAILKRIEDSQCQCDRCKEDRRRQNSFVTYIIDDTKETDRKAVPILKGCISKPICTCMEKYKKRWEQFEKTRGIRKVQEALKSLDEKFVINGTAIGPDGKIVYIISSVMTKPCCQCSRLKEMEEERKKTLKKMPMLPGGCIKYHIAGVQERPEGNVYIVGGTTENTECDCMALYERFTREHSLCLKLYNEYMKKIAYDTEEYLKEINSQQYSSFSASASWTESEVDVVAKSCSCHCDRATQMCCCSCTCQDQEPSVDCICSVQSCPCGFDHCECVTEEGTVQDESLYEGEDECICPPSSEISNQQEVSRCACLTEGLSSNLISVDDSGKKQLEGEKTKLSVPSKSQSVNVAESKLVQDQEEDNILERIMEEYKKHPQYKIENPPGLERYMIFKKLPVKQREQKNILKTALKKLAEDGFPLARLPDVHNLPIFRAWWRFRTRDFSTSEQRDGLLNLVDKINLHQLDGARLTSPSIGYKFLRNEKHKQNYDHLSLIKAYDQEQRTNFFRLNKQISINYSRELYTLMRYYDYYNKSFNRVYFSYMPSTEEDMQVDQIWKTGELLHNNNP